MFPGSPAPARCLADGGLENTPLLSRSHRLTSQINTLSYRNTHTQLIHTKIPATSVCVNITVQNAESPVSVKRPFIHYSLSLYGKEQGEHSDTLLILCSTDKSKSFRFVTAWGVNKWQDFFFIEWIILLKGTHTLSHAHSKSLVFSQAQSGVFEFNGMLLSSPVSADSHQ